MPPALGFATYAEGDAEVDAERAPTSGGENEAVFRSVNEMVRPVEPTWMRILCECGDGTCREHIVVAQDAYSRVRERATLS